MTDGTYTFSGENQDRIKGLTSVLVDVETSPPWHLAPAGLRPEAAEFLAREANGGDDHAEA